MREGDLRVFAFDHRAQFEEMEGATPGGIGAFKVLCLEAARRVAQDRPGHGILCDGRLGTEALTQAGRDLWVGRPVEWPGSRPLTLEAEASNLAAWPKHHVVKCLVLAHPGDTSDMWDAQSATVAGVQASARAAGLGFLLEIVPSKVGPLADDTTARALHRFYADGLRPDWWKLEAQPSPAAWEACVAAVEKHDPQCRGIVVLGLDAPMDRLADGLAEAARVPRVRGFAVGRTIFGDAARAWLAGRLTDEEAVSGMADRYRKLCAAWDAARRDRGAPGTRPKERTG